MRLATASYVDQLKVWPASGNHIMAQYDAEHIVVYQAYCPSIAAYAVTHQRFGGEFSFSRMSWIKPNVLWMMFRSGWASKEGQAHVLAVAIRRSGFEEILSHAVASSFHPERHTTPEAWRDALATSSVRVQWDPDHDPFGQKLPRRAVQLGLRGEMLQKYASEWVVWIDDVTPFVKQQHDILQHHGIEKLVVPSQRPYMPMAASAATRVEPSGVLS